MKNYNNELGVYNRREKMNDKLLDDLLEDVRKQIKRSLALLKVETK